MKQESKLYEEGYLKGSSNSVVVAVIIVVVML